MMMQPVPGDSTFYSNDSIQDLIRQIDRLPSEGIYIAVAVGLLMYIIGWFGGTRNSVKKVIWCVIIVTLVGFFSLPVAARIFNWLLPALGSTGAFALVYIFWSLILISMGISLYETMIVTAEEGRPN